MTEGYFGLTNNDGEGANVDFGSVSMSSDENKFVESSVIGESKPVELEIKKENDNIVFIGNKPLVNYIRGVVTQFKRKNALEVVIKSRGKFISKAVDVAEISRRSLEENGIRIKKVDISSESFEASGKKTNISTMDIVLGK